jgi:hypothetical protein
MTFKKPPTAAETANRTQALTAQAGKDRMAALSDAFGMGSGQVGAMAL